MSVNLKTELVKIAKGALLAGLGAAGASALNGLAGLDLGEWTPYAGAAISVLANACRKLVMPRLKALLTR